MVVISRIRVFLPYFQAAGRAISVKRTMVVIGLFRRLLRVKRELRMSVSNHWKTCGLNDDLSKVNSRLSLCISELELKLQKSQGENEIQKSQIDLLASVVRRDHERVAAETKMYMIAADGHEPVRHMGATVASKVTPGM